MRAILLAGGLSLLLTLVGTRYAIRVLASRGYGQLIRDDGPTTHHTKRGTPTMGGLVIVLASVSVIGVLKTAAAVAVGFPLVVLFVPLLDTSFVIARRLKHGQAPWRADSGHLHHRFAPTPNPPSRETLKAREDSLRDEYRRPLGRLEIIDSRYADFRFSLPDVVADILAKCYLGKEESILDQIRGADGQAAGAVDKQLMRKDDASFYRRGSSGPWCHAAWYRQARRSRAAPAAS